MKSNQPEGFLRRINGVVQNAFGSASKAPTAQVRGKANRAGGQAQQACGEVLDEVGYLVSDRPVLALLAGVGVDVLLRIALARR